MSLALFETTREVTEARGLPAYEVSNHARPGGESRHNLIYWRYGEYAGVGPGAHGRLLTAKGRLAQETERHPEMWLTQVESEGHGLVESVVLSREEQGDEFLLMGLRLSEGVDPRTFERLTGRDIDPARVESLIERRVSRMRRARAHSRDRDGRAAARHRGGRRRGVTGGAGAAIIRPSFWRRRLAGKAACSSPDRPCTCQTQGRAVEPADLEP